MAYRANPFLERMSDRTTSDQEFVQFFSPKVLERIDERCLDRGVHVFRSPPGGGKTTILRAFTPKALEAFWHARRTQPETYKQFVERGVFDNTRGPQLLGVFLSCAAGYADLPSGASNANDDLFRALLDCRVVLRAIRSFLVLVGLTPEQGASEVELEYDEIAHDLKEIPLATTADEMIRWAESREREVYTHLDEINATPTERVPGHKRFESVLWLQAVRFVSNGRSLAPRRLIMIDDVQKLRKSQRNLLFDELTTLRPELPIWLASRTIAFSDQFLAQGARNGRDLHEYALDDLWGSGRSGQSFTGFAQNILDRRFALQATVPGGTFSHYISEQMGVKDVEEKHSIALEKFKKHVEIYRNKERYREWLARAEKVPDVINIDTILELYATRILIARDEANKQRNFEFSPLSEEEMEERDSSSVKGAASIFVNHDAGCPYYFGIDRICAMSTYNIEELLSLAAELYEGMKAKQVLRREPALSPAEQEKRLRECARKKRDFIPRNHSDGRRAQRLLDAIGIFCREKTFQINAPYAPGVTGVRLSNTELSELDNLRRDKKSPVSELYNVLFECVAENLLVLKESSASTGREAGSVFYLNRSLCAHYGLPLQYGGWQESSITTMIEWMNVGLKPRRRLNLEPD